MLVRCGEGYPAWVRQYECSIYLSPCVVFKNKRGYPGAILTIVYYSYIHANLRRRRVKVDQEYVGIVVQGLVCSSRPFKRYFYVLLGL